MLFRSDDVPEQDKNKRLNEIIDLQQRISKQKNMDETGKIHTVLVEGPSKRRKEDWQGRTDTNKVVVFPNDNFKILRGDIVKIKISRSSSATLFGNIVV